MTGAGHPWISFGTSGCDADVLVFFTI